jgi:hypothetical protein
MLRIAGIWWIAVSVIHGLGGIIIYAKQWQAMPSASFAIAQDGWFNVIAPNPLAPIFRSKMFKLITPTYLSAYVYCRK